MSLVGILLPALASAKGKARQTKCLSNLRQLGIAIGQYASQWDDTYPYDVKPRALAALDASPAYDGTNKWDGSPIVGLLSPYLRSSYLSFCPDRPKKMDDLGPLTNYEFNGFIALNDSPLAPHRGAVRSSDVLKPSRVLLFEDYGSSSAYHAGFRNFALCDGSARAYPANMQSAPPCHAKWWN